MFCTRGLRTEVTKSENHLRRKENPTYEHQIFFINNQIKTENLIIECCPAYVIWSGDYWCMSKPLHKEISRIPKNDSRYENRWSELIVKDTADTG